MENIPQSAALSAAQVECASAAVNSFPFKDEFKADPCCVSVCLRNINCTWLTYPFSPLRAVSDYIRDPQYLGKLTAAIRAAAETGNTDEKNRLKATLPYMMFPSVAQRRKTELIIRPTGLLALDIDKLPSLAVAEELKRTLFDDPNLDVRMTFVSPSGRGVKAIVRRPVNAYESIIDAQRTGQESINEYFNATYGQKYGVASDPSGIDIVRTCYLCHDPNVLFKE